MTTEDAIYVIGQIGQWMSPKEAFTMAIDALEKQKEQGPVHEDDSKPQTDVEILTHYLSWAESDEENCPYTWKRLAKAIKAGIDALNQTLPEADTKAFNDGVKEGRRLEREDMQKEQKPDPELIKQSWYTEGYIDGKFKKEPMWNLKTDDGWPRYEKNEKYGWPLEQKAAEWSEEDERFLCNLIQYFKGEEALRYSEEKTISWLKSLRPQPQRKDTYYDIIHSILAMLKDMDFMQITPEHRVSLLNDIRVKCKNADECAAILDEPHWKPSEEQMKALLSKLPVVKGGGDKVQDILESLYDQLKKL